MADATLGPWYSKATEVDRITIGTTTQIPGYAKNTPPALHFQTTTTWPIKYWDGLTWQNIGLGADPTGNATVTAVNAFKPINKSRISIGASTQIPQYAQGSDQALHFLVNTNWMLSYWNGNVWANVFILADPTGDAVLSDFHAHAGINRITVGVAALRPVYWVGAPLAMHFQSDTTYPISFFNGSAWANISLMAAP